MDIIQFVTSKLGVSPQQAEVGLGILFRFAKEKLDGPEFEKLAQYIPNAAGLAAAAPVPPAAAEAGLGGMVGMMLAGLGGKGGSLGNLSTIMTQFSAAGLDSSKLQGFAESIAAFLKEQGAAEEVKQILMRAVLK